MTFDPGLAHLGPIFVMTVYFCELINVTSLSVISQNQEGGGAYLRYQH